MKVTPFTLALALIYVFAGRSAAAGDQENIQGTWTLETMTLEGKAMRRVAVVYVFTGETLTVRPEVGKEDKAAFTLDTTSKPKLMIVQHDHHLPDAKPDRTPYELDGDILKIALTSPDEHATGVTDNGHILFTLKRKQP